MPVQTYEASLARWKARQDEAGRIPVWARDEHLERILPETEQRRLKTGSSHAGLAKRAWGRGYSGKETTQKWNHLKQATKTHD